MKIGIYTPYLNTLGGGEKYMLTIAEALANKGDVDIFLGSHLYDLDIESLKAKALSILGIDLTDVSFIKAPFGEGTSGFKRSLFLKKYDYFFYLTDGSIFYSTAKHNILHFQVPFDNSGISIKDRFKLSSWKTTIFNSRFTEEIIEKYWPVKNGMVIYPPVDVEKLKSLKKKKQIISVGRFHSLTKSKKQEIMIEAFKKMSNQKGFMGWSLHLAGGMEDGHEEYLDELRKSATGAEIHFYPNIKIEKLRELYGESKIYWHAAGFGEDDPKKYEHFGISTVEAMAAGCVPVVINKGGQPEIVTRECGFLWNSLEDLEMKTLSLIMMEKQWEEKSKNAVLRAKNFDKEHFVEAIRRIVYGD